MGAAAFTSWLTLAAAQSVTTLAVHPRIPGDQVDPTVVFTSQGLVVAWVSRRAAQSEVLYAHSPDLATFSAPFPLGAPRGTETIRPHLAARGDLVVAVWSDAGLGDHDVWVASSTDGGRTFAAPIVAAGGPGGQVDPRAAVLEDGSIAVVFHDSFGSTSADGGLVWRARVAKSDAGGRFGPSRLLGGDAGGLELFPAISGAGTEGSPLAAVWLREGGDGGTAILLASSIDGGESFGAPLRIDTPLGRHGRPRVSVPAEGALIACFPSLLPAEGQRLSPAPVLEDSEYLDVLAVTSTTGGRAFTPPAIVNETRTLTQHACDTSALGDRAAITFVDHSRPAIRRILVRRSEDGGATFGPEETVAETPPNGEVHHPSVAVGPDRIGVVFEDASRGSWDVRAAIIDR